MLKPLPLLLLACLALLTACRESEFDKFGDDYDPVNERLLTLGGSLAKDLQKLSRETPQQNEKILSGAARETGAIRRELGKLDPPSGLETNVRKLSAALGAAEKKLDDFANRAGDKEKVTAREVIREFGPIARRLDTAQNAIAGATDLRAN